MVMLKEENLFIIVQFWTLFVFQHLNRHVFRTQYTG